MTRAPAKARAAPERGAALLVAMVSIAVLTALAVDLAYQSRVSLRIAANARDELRASYLARSGVALSRLVLSFQQNLDDASKPAGPTPTTIPTIPRVQIWRIVPVGSQLVQSLFPGSGPALAAPASDAGAADRPRPGFEAAIEDEARKVNAQLGGLVRTSDPRVWAKVQALYHLICDEKWDPLFDREDERGVRVSREELLVYLRDWVDDESPPQMSALVPVAGGGGHCTMLANAAQPFENAFSDENAPYDRGDDRYKTKNNHMDSLDELYLVAGIGDAFMAAFGDALTVYLEKEAKQNVNELDSRGLRALVFTVAQPTPDSVSTLGNPDFWQLLELGIMQKTLGGWLSMSVTDMRDLIMGAGLQVKTELFNQNGPFTDRSTTFRIRSTGTSGDVTSAIDAVVRLVRQQPGAPAGGVAPTQQVIHWREE